MFENLIQLVIVIFHISCHLCEMQRLWRLYATIQIGLVMQKSWSIKFGVLFIRICVTKFQKNKIVPLPFIYIVIVTNHLTNHMSEETSYKPPGSLPPQYPTCVIFRFFTLKGLAYGRVMSYCGDSYTFPEPNCPQSWKWA